ncbi:MAG TPA: glycosyltransferase family 2 protein [Solirubrobacteraceae bacterium]|nr:glycosyltransferase family 2 protein [Solirubrobacteraceae bacterium]
MSASTSEMTETGPPADLMAEAEGVPVTFGGEAVPPERLGELFAGTVAIVVPAYEEAENLVELLPTIPDTVCGVAARVLVVDDGSPDDTTGVALAQGAVVATFPANRGGGAALRCGYALMIQAGARCVVTMDADGQHLPEDLELLAAPVLEGRVQLTQGSRVLGHREPGVFARELGIALFNRLVTFLTRTKITDCSNGYRGMAPAMLPHLDLRQRQFHTSEFLIEALTRGFVVEEVPVTVVHRLHGKTKKPPTIRYGYGFSKAIFQSWRRSVRRRALAKISSSDGKQPAGAPRG